MAVIIYGLMITCIALGVIADDDIDKNAQINQETDKFIATLADELVEKLQTKRNSASQDSSVFAPTPVPAQVNQEPAKEQTEQVTEESMINVSVLQDPTASSYDYPPYASGNEQQLQENNNNDNMIKPLLINTGAEQLLASAPLPDNHYPPYAPGNEQQSQENNNNDNMIKPILSNAAADQLLAYILNSPAVPVQQKVQIIKHVPYPVLQPVPVQIPQPYAVPIAVPQLYPIDEVQKQLPYLALQLHKILVEHHVPYPLQNLLPYPIEKPRPPLIKKRIYPKFTVIRRTKESYYDD